MEGRDVLSRQHGGGSSAILYIVSSKELIKAEFEKNSSIPVRGAAKVNGIKSLLALFDYCLGYKLF